MTKEIMYGGLPRVRDSTKKYETYEGARVEFLTLLKKSGKAKNGSTIWLCKCECGAIKEINQSSLRAGLTRSCGCLFKKNVKNFSKTHGKTNTAEYNSWLAMKQRCFYDKHEEYHNYGGRGITVCAEWFLFENFFRDMGNKPGKEYSIDRINVNGNYEPSNCKWSTPKEQVINRRPIKSKSGEKGIHWHGLTEKWQLSQNINGIKEYQGLYNTIEEAKKAKEILWKKQ